MKVIRRYAPSSINFYLLPDLMEQIKTSLESYWKENNESAVYRISSANLLFNTISQTIETKSLEEFKEILRSLKETILTANAGLYNSYVFDGDEESESSHSESLFEFAYRQDTIEIILSQNSFENIRKLFITIEEILSLEAIKPKMLEEENIDRKRSIFVAHSFDQTGKSYAYELNQFLKLIQFEVLTGEGYSPESISKKVLKRLKAQENVIVIISKEEVPTWLTQEAAGATFLEKPLFILIEKGANFISGIHGDSEYIEFSPGEISETFIPILQGLQERGYSFL